ncbi:MAG: hypothetical protein H6999_07955 [Hahellaceae bacterium]|nr:hypothetical protein [Hahellaceae bacterium]MCP5169676.1 hypothetical protein [Hahellaceae bacterium]
MADEHSPSARKHEHALAKLALALSTPGSVTSNEEHHEALALLAEGKLDATQRRKLLALIDSHPSLYRQWINLQEMVSAGDTPEAANETFRTEPETESLGARLRRWFAGYTLAPLGTAAAFGLVLGLGINVLQQPATPEADLVSVTPADQPSAKASLEEVQFGQVTEESETHTLPDKMFICSPSSLWLATLCVSRTPGRQHWLTLDGHGQITALLPPLKADNIEDLAFNAEGKFSAVVTQQEGKHVLTLIEWHSDAQLDEPRLSILETSKNPIRLIAWKNAELSYRVEGPTTTQKSVDANDQD